MSTGFKPHLVREILGLGKEQFRYWRNNIDPTPSRPFFSTSDLLTYRVIKVLILDKHISVKYLKNLDLTELFIYFQITKNSDLVDKYIMLDEENNIYKIISVEEIVSYIRNKIALINLRQVSEDHNKELEDFGKENNVVSISRNIRNFVK